MNSTVYITLSVSLQNLTTIINESWFIPVDILMIICSTLVIVLSSIFLYVIFSDRTCHTVSMLLVTNSCICALLFGCLLLSLCVFTLKNDLQQIKYEDYLCAFRAYFSYVTTTLFNTSFLFQALHRYITAVYPAHLFWQSSRAQFLLIGLGWLFSFSHPLMYMFTGELIYNVYNQICSLPLHLSFSIIFMASNAYILPVLLIILIYVKLVLHVKQMSKRVTPVNALSRARRELRMVRRTVILVTIQVIVCLPYAVFIFMSFFTSIPKHHYRIGILCIDVSVPLVMIILFLFTDPLKLSLMKKTQNQPNVIIPTLV